MCVYSTICLRIKVFIPILKTNISNIYRSKFYFYFVPLV